MKASSFSLISNITTMARIRAIENTYVPRNLRMIYPSSRLMGDLSRIHAGILIGILILDFFIVVLIGSVCNGYERSC